MADSWRASKVKDYYNSDSSYYVRVVPTEIPEKYWNWINASAKQKNKFSPQDTTIIHCHAMMFKKTAGGDSLLWNKKLINKISPVDALVSDYGEYFVTFDNWHSLGYGIDVLAIYDAKGMLLKRHMLEDISPFAINIHMKEVFHPSGGGVDKNLATKIKLKFASERKKTALRPGFMILQN